MTNIRRALEAAAGGGGDATYVEDVFSTYLFKANGSTGQTITNGIDLAGEGGMVWHKDRVATYGHVVWDTARGNDGVLNTDNDFAEQTATDSITYNANGYDVNAATGNEGTNATVSWTFRKAENFFTMVKFTADATFDIIAHDLGSVPGFVVYKCVTSRTDVTSGDWQSWHSSLNNNDSLVLNTNAAKVAYAGYIGDVTSTQCQFYCTSGETYIAYYFGNNQAEFGAGSDESIIKCASYTGNASADGPTISLGWEPQYVLLKNADASGNWYVMDIMRGISFGGDSARLSPNLSDAESSGGVLEVNADGFKIINDYSNWNGSGNTIIYIAIRRPMKVPEAGTEVYLAQTANSTNPGPLFSASFPVDMVIWKENITAAGTFRSGARLTQGSYGVTNGNSAWVADSAFDFDYSYGWRNSYGVDANDISWMFGRAPEFMDVVAQVGNGVGGASWNHNLGVVPEMIIGKNRTDAVDWAIYHHGVNGGVDPADWQLQLNDTAAQVDSNSYWDNVLPTTTHFTTGGSQNTNGTGDDFIFYLFATLAGVSKVGSYTADATLTTIDCGFSAGARFILIKRTDAVGDWYLYDSVRGIVAGDDPYARPNEALAQVTNTDWIDPDNSGFQITAEVGTQLNKDTGTYIFLAIA